MVTSKKTVQGTMFAALCGLCLMAETTGAIAGGKDAPQASVVFDIDKRKKAKRTVTHWLRTSVYGNLRFQGERDIARDDGVSDRKDEFASYLGVVGRANIARGVTGFVHGEVSLKDKKTHARSYDRIMQPQLKEALVSVALTDRAQVSVGRLRFSDPHKWVADASVDGLHFAHRSQGRALEFAAVSGTRDITADYLIAHISDTDPARRIGLFAIAERDGNQRRLHLSTYRFAQVSERFSYQLNAGVVMGEAAQDRSYGVGVDVRAHQELSTGRWNPQITYGFAFGTSGFQQSGLHSNKTYDGGQTQFHRYGYVFQPELTNIAIGTLAYGLRPSRRFSMDLGLHAYLQPSRSTIGPDARIKGTTTGNARFLGSEISLAGAWRPGKKSKMEFGVARFTPGSAYSDRSKARRVYARISYYF